MSYPDARTFLAEGTASTVPEVRMCPTCFKEQPEAKEVSGAKLLLLKYDTDRKTDAQIESSW